MTTETLQAFLEQHALPDSFAAHAAQWFDPLIDGIAKRAERQRSNNGPGNDRQVSDGQALCVGISGSQGSGKSTLADYCCFQLQSRHRLRAISFSLDDLYLTAAERQTLAETVHPLLKTRGVPGTHDIPLGLKVLNTLKSGATAIDIPTFDKLLDDRLAEPRRIEGPIDLIIFEGWCLGAQAQKSAALQTACNALEREHDSEGRWRQYVNQQLEQHYPALFNEIDYWVMLKAPSFDCVLNWRCEQELKLAANLHADDTNGRSVMSRAEVRHFIEHYQRITEQLLKDLPARVDHLFILDSERQLVESIEQTAASGQ